jgi:hypothetical protein
MNARAELTLIELIRSFMEYAASRGAESFPPMLFGSLWHLFLWKIRELPEIANIIGGFDWDGPHPKNRIFKEFTSHASYSYFARSRDDGRLILTHARPANQLIPSCLGVFEKMFAAAKQMPGFLENQEAS